MLCRCVCYVGVCVMQVCVCVMQVCVCVMQVCVCVMQVCVCVMQVCVRCGIYLEVCDDCYSKIRTSLIGKLGFVLYKHTLLTKEYKLIDQGVQTYIIDQGVQMQIPLQLALHPYPAGSHMNKV